MFFYFTENRIACFLLPKKVGEQVKLLKENMISRIIEDLTLLHRYSAFIRQIPTVDIIAVTEYLAGSGSLREICKKYKIRSKRQLIDWIKVYNSGGNFKRKMSGGSRMKNTRKTTQEERVRIAKECIENGDNYGEIAIKYQVSYQNVYSWVKKYRELGEAGLEDRRGQRTAQQEPRTEEERLRIEVAQLRHELYMTKMERDLLKKLEEIERREAYRK